MKRTPTLSENEKRRPRAFRSAGVVLAFFRDVKLRSLNSDNARLNMGATYCRYLLSTTAAKVLWLFGDDDHITEVGAMNIFFLLAKEGGGGVELVTSPLDTGDILDGEAVRR